MCDRIQRRDISENWGGWEKLPEEPRYAGSYIMSREREGEGEKGKDTVRGRTCLLIRNKVKIE